MNNPLIGVIMGSDSDLRIMQRASELLQEFGVRHEISIVSAHRTPQRLFDYAATAEDRGLKAIIAGAGGAAHLPGMIAAVCALPVIGVPINATALGGEDALLSIVQMPAGVPVATVAIDNAANAALLAIQILGTADASLRQKMRDYKSAMQQKVLAKASAITEIR